MQGNLGKGRTVAGRFTPRLRFEQLELRNLLTGLIEVDKDSEVLERTAAQEGSWEEVWTLGSPTDEAVEMRVLSYFNESETGVAEELPFEETTVRLLAFSEDESLEPTELMAFTDVSLGPDEDDWIFATASVDFEDDPSLIRLTAFEESEDPSRVVTHDSHPDREVTVEMIATEVGGEDEEEVTFSIRSHSPWHNTADPIDTNADGARTPLDVLLVLNALELTGTVSLGEAPSASMSLVSGEEATSHYYLDVNNDGFLSPIDLLVRINYLNGMSGEDFAGDEGLGQDAAEGVNGFAADESVSDSVSEQARMMDPSLAADDWIWKDHEFAAADEVWDGLLREDSGTSDDLLRISPDAVSLLDDGEESISGSRVALDDFWEHFGSEEIDPSA